MHTTRLNVNEGDSCCVSLYAAHHSKRSKYTASTTNQSKRSSVEGYICNFYYDPIMHVMKNNWWKPRKHSMFIQTIANLRLYKTISWKRGLILILEWIYIETFITFSVDYSGILTQHLFGIGEWPTYWLINEF